MTEYLSSCNWTSGVYNYFKLRDLGDVLGFAVGYSRDRGVYIETE